MTAERVEVDGTVMYRVNGLLLTQEEYAVQIDPSQWGAPPPAPKCGVGPHLSDALAVHPDQVSEAMESAKKRGVPTEFQPDGRPVMTSRSHQKRYLKAYGFHNNDGGYGD